MATFHVPFDGSFTDSRSGLRYRYEQGAVIDAQAAYHLGMPGAGATTAGAVVATATPGAPFAYAGDNGTVPAGWSFASVTSEDANRIVILPAPAPGATVTLRNGGTGYELRTTEPAAVAINGGGGANAESAIPAEHPRHLHLRHGVELALHQHRHERRGHGHGAGGAMTDPYPSQLPTEPLAPDRRTETAEGNPRRPRRGLGRTRTWRGRWGRSNQRIAALGAEIVTMAHASTVNLSLQPPHYSLRDRLYLPGLVAAAAADSGYPGDGG